MQEENDSDNLDENGQYVEHLSGMRHIEKDTEDVYRKQGKDDGLDGLDDDFLEIIAGIFQITGIQVCQSESDSKGHDKGCHYIEGFRYGYGEEGSGAFCLTDFLQRNVPCDEAGEKCFTYAERKKSGEQGSAVSQKNGGHQHLSGPFPDIGDGRSDQSYNNQWNDEVQELAEKGVECHENAYRKCR